MKESTHTKPSSKTLPTVVIKVGTSSLIRPQQNCLNLTSLASIVETVRDLKIEGYNVVLVSSGAVGVGCQRLGLVDRPTELAKKQALAAVGQVHLMRYYDDLFSACGLTCSQVLLTLENLANRGQYINAANTFAELLDYGVIPVVNENDTVAVEQLRIGDNDTLSAQVATVVQAEWLFLLTDVDALYTANPSIDPSAKPIHDVPDLWSLQVDTSTRGTQWGTGGMATKLTAARIATAGGCNMGICHFNEPRNVLKILKGEKIGTVFRAADAPLKGKKRWVLSMPIKGEVWLDAGAVRAVRDRRCSLFSAGITHVEGDFQTHEAVRICDEEGRELARGLINYSKEDVEKVKGMSSRNFVKALGDSYGEEEIVHRANLCLLVKRRNLAGVEQNVHHDSDGEEEFDDEDGNIVGLGLRPAGLSRTNTPAPNYAVHNGGGNGSGVDTITEEEEVRARLAMLTARADEEWRAEAARAVAAERAEEGAAVGARISGEDVNEDGWLPK